LEVARENLEWRWRSAMNFIEAIFKIKYQKSKG
jgi:hypothetical protein